MTPVVPAIDPHQAAARIKQRAREIGFDLCGITSAAPSRHAEYLRQWLDDGCAGTMQYLHERFDERTDCRRLLDGAQSVICLAMNYHVRLERERDRPGKIARYALGEDYHVHLKDRLYDLADWIRDTFVNAQTKCSVDTVPVLERELAARSGIGWVGKNTLVINERIGSWTFLGEVITTLALPDDSPAVDRCGTCTRCIDACPTGAIEPYRLDASRCISYLTIEHAGDIDATLAQKIGGWVVGCDICQDVCPWNGRAPVATLESLRPRHPAGVIDLDVIEGWTQEEYWAATRKSAMRRVKLPQFKRNAAIARGECFFRGMMR